LVKSMTGYGKGEGDGLSVEMRSVNHKFLDLSLKLPRGLLPLESRLKRYISERISRGRVDVYITRNGEETPRSLKLDTEAAKRYMELLNELKGMFDLPGEINLEMLASYKDIMTEEEVALDMEEAWAALQRPLDECIKGLDEMRAREGEALVSDILERAKLVEDAFGFVESRSPEVVKDYAKRLSERIAKIAEGVSVDQDRLATEVALYADRCDVTEEVVRGRSHIAQLRSMLKEGGAIGRKVDFLLQELNREINTVGSKASDQEISHRVVEVKSELEKIREQVQNIE
jgi:uncharacterized protein (TIGR00255 family)